MHNLEPDPVDWITEPTEPNNNNVLIYTFVSKVEPNTVPMFVLQKFHCKVTKVPVAFI